MLEDKFKTVVKALEGSDRYDEALEALADLRTKFKCLETKRSKHRVYTKETQRAIVAKVLGYSGKGLHNVNNPEITTRETIALAEYIEELINKVKE